MSKRLLIYDKVVPISKERHRDWSVKSGEEYSFAQDVNSAPLTAVEFPRAAAEYAIVFAGTDEAVVPTVILGRRDGENVYVTREGNWQAKYVPAFIRRYPFVFSHDDKGKTWTLCIDEGYVGCHQDGRGERLFDADGNQTQYLQGVLTFLKHYQAHFQRTQAFCKKLMDLGLLESMQAQFSLSSGEQTSLGGFKAVNRQRLKELKDEQLLDLVRSDELELIHLHLQSIQNFKAMSDLGGEGTAPKKEGKAKSGGKKGKVKALETEPVAVDA